MVQSRLLAPTPPHAVDTTSFKTLEEGPSKSNDIMQTMANCQVIVMAPSYIREQYFWEVHLININVHARNKRQCLHIENMRSLQSTWWNWTKKNRMLYENKLLHCILQYQGTLFKNLVFETFFSHIWYIKVANHIILPNDIILFTAAIFVVRLMLNVSNFVKNLHFPIHHYSFSPLPSCYNNYCSYNIKNALMMIETSGMIWKSRISISCSFYLFHAKNN